MSHLLCGINIFADLIFDIFDNDPGLGTDVPRDNAQGREAAGQEKLASAHGSQTETRDENKNRL